jgi:hypothetical protein
MGTKPIISAESVIRQAVHLYSLDYREMPESMYLICISAACYFGSQQLTCNVIVQKPDHENCLPRYNSYRIMRRV